MSTSLIIYEKIKTTIQKAKLLRSFVEELINYAKSKNLNSYRKISTHIQNKKAINKLYNVLVPRYANRIGGYVQIIRVGNRRGDSAEIVIVKLIQ